MVLCRTRRMDGGMRDAAVARGPERLALLRPTRRRRASDAIGPRSRPTRARAACTTLLRHATRSRRACCWRHWPTSRSTSSTTSGIRDQQVSCCSRRCGGRRSAACASACCWTTTIRATWTRRSPRWTRTRASRCACTTRSSRVVRASLDFMTDFARLNRRMHNKSFTADNQLSIVGGRNIGNEYFARRARRRVRRSGRARRRYRRPGHRGGVRSLLEQRVGVPGDGIVGPAPPDAAATLEARFAAVRGDPESARVSGPFARRPFCANCRKIASRSNGRRRALWSMLRRRRSTRRTVRTSCCSPRSSVPSVRRNSRSTSSRPISCRATTVRKRLLRCRGAASRSASSPIRSPRPTRRSCMRAMQSTGRNCCRRACRSSSSSRCWPTGARSRRRASAAARSAALHAKVYAVDRRRIFVGSFNFDQRSAFLNTEMGLVIDSPRLASDLASDLDAKIVLFAYEVRLAPDGRLQWIERTGVGRCGLRCGARDELVAAHGRSTSCRSCRSTGCCSAATQGSG